MDAKIGDDVITPRHGKPVEIAALWLNALATLRGFAVTLGARDDAALFARSLERTRNGFQRFWNPARGFLFDVLDGPHGSSAALRPNQLFAVSLTESALSNEWQRSVVDACARALVTTYGLRTLAPDEPGYRGKYEGDPAQRDAGCTGAFDAHNRADPALGHVVGGGGLGAAPVVVGELADGDAPHMPGGAIAQAWSVAEVLRAWSLLSARA